MKSYDDYDLDPLTTEEKIVLAHEQPFDLEPWEITEVVQHALSRLTRELDVEEVDVFFDIIYEAVSEALERARTRF
jgi:hypothetical protein